MNIADSCVKIFMCKMNLVKVKATSVVCVARIHYIVLYTLKSDILISSNIASVQQFIWKALKLLINLSFTEHYLLLMDLAVSAIMNYCW